MLFCRPNQKDAVMNYDNVSLDTDIVFAKILHCPNVG